MKKNYFIALFGIAFFNAAAQTYSGFNTANQVSNTASPEVDCAIAFSFPTGNQFSSGLTSDGTYLYTSSVWNDIIMKFDLTGQLVGTIPNPTNPGDGGGDLAYDGTNLLFVAEQSSMLYKIRPSDGAVMDSFALPFTETPDYFGCAYEDGFIWVTQYADHTLLKLDAQTGGVISTFSYPFFVLGLEMINGDLYGIEFNNDNAMDAMNLVKFDKTNGAIVESTPWCIPFSTGLALADDHFWGLSSGLGIGTNTIYKLEGMLGTDAFLNPQVSVFPNPVSDKIQIMHTQNIESVEIINLFGTKVFSNTNLQQTHTEINVSDLARGMYILRITSDGKIQNTKILKQ